MRLIGRGALVALALVALAVPAAAARAAAQDTYAQQLTAAGRQLSASLEGLGAVTGMSIEYPVKPDAARRAAVRLAAVQTKLRTLAKTLAAIKPPAAVAAPHARLAKSVALLAAQVTPVLRQLRNGYLVAAAKLPSLPAAAAVGAAVTSLRKHGYRVG